MTASTQRDDGHAQLPNNAARYPALGAQQDRMRALIFPTFCFLHWCALLYNSPASPSRPGLYTVVLFCLACYTDWAQDPESRRATLVVKEQACGQP
eukprot:3985812-Pyramimonas_sp.AAC.1